MGLGPPPSVSRMTGTPLAPSSRYLHASSAHLRDVAGRTAILRGINVSGSAKNPVGQPNWKLDGFWERAEDGNMTFIGRGFGGDEEGGEEIHLRRLKGWGFNCIRWVITWEALEHKGPGIYDEEYIAYVVRMLRLCKEHGFYVYIDPHQDLWSRFSGGSGAPYWTLIACGLNPRAFTVTNAATVQCEYPSPSTGAPSPNDFPAMMWASSYHRLACLTLFTLWNAGRDYAPKCVIDGVNIQDYLQTHYFAAITKLGEAIRDAGDLEDECVIGWDSINEPNAGLLGIEDLNQHSKESILRVGPMPTPFQAMRLGMGQRLEIENYKVGSLGSKRDGSVVVDPQGVRSWLDADSEVNGSKYGWTRGPDWELGTCIWGLHGVWDPETDELLEPDYFEFYRGGAPGAVQEHVDFGKHYWLPHWKAYAKVVRAFHEEAIHFIHTPVFQVPPKIEGEEIGGRAVHSMHFYDGLTLVTKHWNWFNADALGILRGKYASVVLGVKIGEAAIRKCMREQLGTLRQDTFDALGQFPTMMGELGIPFDLDKKKAYVDGDYSAQVKALDASLNACDGTNLLNYTIWTYAPDNSHEWGDRWNGEDLALWSSDDKAKMSHYRSLNEGLDLAGKIHRKRSRAGSKASTSSNSGSVYNSKSATPMASNSSLRLPGPNMSPAARLQTLPTGSPSANFSTPLPQTPLFEVTNPFGNGVALDPPGSPPPFYNLNDGARAIAAFVRPYPLKTVGTPIDINFDIRSSVFTLSIRVDAGDVSDPTLPTQIFVPLVHYAAFPSRINHSGTEDLSQSQESLSFPPMEKTGSGGGSPFLPLGAQLSLPESGRSDDDHALALKVTTSHGRFETDGEMLSWFYPQPTTGSITVKIEIQRVGGAIPTWVQMTGARSDARGNLSRERIASLRQLGELRYYVAGALGASLLVWSGWKLIS